MLAENGGGDGTPLLLAEQPEARCNQDMCLTERVAGGRTWRILATRSVYLVPAGALTAACREADIVISERRLPGGCTPRWLRLDRATLAKTGGMAISLASGEVRTVYRVGDEHPWRVRPGAGMQYRGGGGSARYWKLPGDGTGTLPRRPETER